MPNGHSSNPSSSTWKQPRKRGKAETPELARRGVNAMRYLLKTGCQWRMLPRGYPPRSTVHDTLTRWTEKGLNTMPVTPPSGKQTGAPAIMLAMYPNRSAISNVTD